MRKKRFFRLTALFLTFFLLLPVDVMAAGSVENLQSTEPAGLPVTVAEKNRMSLSEIAATTTGGTNGDRGIYYGARTDEGASAELLYDPNNWDGCYYAVEENSVLNIFPRNGLVVPSEGLSPVIGLEISEAGQFKIEYTIIRTEITDDGRTGWDGLLFTVEQGTATYAAEYLRGSSNTASGTVVLDVSAGDRINLVFDKLVSHWGDNCDYQITIGYVENETITSAMTESAIRAKKRLLPITDGGSSCTLAAVSTQAVAGANGDLGVSFYGYDGTNKIDNLRYDANTGLYWMGDSANDQLHINPTQGKIITSSTYGAAIGITAPEEGILKLEYAVCRPVETADTGKDNWDGMIFSVQQGQNCYVYDALNKTNGTSQGVVYLDVLAGETIDMIFDKISGNWGDNCTYQVTVSYDNDATVSAPVPKETVKPEQSYRYVDLASTTNGENGLTFYYTDGTTLTAFSEYNSSLERWYSTGEDGLLAKPCQVEADNYGLGGSSATQFVVIGYKSLVSGSLDLEYWTANQSGAGYDVSVAINDLSQIVENSTYRVTDGENQVKTNTVTLNVTKGDEIYLIYEPVGPVVGDWFGYKATVTYKTVIETDDGNTSAQLVPLSNEITLEPIATRNVGETTTSFADGIANFTYSNSGKTVRYVVDTTSAAVQSGLIDVSVSVNGSAPVNAVTNAGTGYLTMTGRILTPAQFAQKANVSMNVFFNENEGKLSLTYTEVYEGITNIKTYVYFMKGQTLTIYADSTSTNGYGGYCNFDTGSSTGMTSSSIDNSVYVEEVSVTNVNNQFYLSAYLDKAKTFGTKVTNNPKDETSGSVHGMKALYELNSLEETNPLSERFYITASESFLDCVYLTSAEKSPYRDMLNNLVVYDQWYYDIATGGKYSDRKNSYMALADNYGIKDVLLVEHRWQRDTLDRSNPVFYPASTYWGTEDEFKSYLSGVREKGWKVALHEDYWFIHPSETNQYWNDISKYFTDVNSISDTIAQNADGSYRIGWEEANFTSYANKSDMMSRYADIESNKINDAYNPDASFLDVNGGVDPSLLNQVTLNANSSTSRTLAQVVADNVDMFKTVKSIYEGPVISEGAQGVRSFGSAYAGFLESGSRELTGCYNGRIMPDYELKYIRPLMVNQGMGPLLRFQTGVTGTEFDFDKYNAMTIAYGHAGFIGDLHYDYNLTDQIINTYYMFRAIQEQYLNTSNTAQSITYYTSDGQAMSLDQAVRAGYDFTTARLRIEYSNGLIICLNFSSSNWSVQINSNQYVLDPNGYAAENSSENFVQYSCLKDGVRVDYVDCTNYTYANPRGNTVSFSNTLTTNTQKVIQK